MPDLLYYKNISIEDFDQKFDSIESLNEKFDFLTTYLLSYGFEREVSLENKNSNVVNVLETKPLEKLIHHAREKFLESSLKIKEEYENKHNTQLKPEIINPEEDEKSETQIAMQKFMSNPPVFLSVCSRSAKKLYANETDLEPQYKYDFEMWRDNLDRLTREFYTISKIFDKNEKDRHVEDVLDKIKAESNMNPEATVNDVIRHNKGGIFENIFRTTSKEYKEFLKAYKDFNNKDNPNYGKDDILDRAARKYIHHKIPNFNLPNDIPTAEEINRFSGTSKNRLEFCVGVIKTIQQRFLRNGMTDSIENNELIEKQSKQNNFQKDLNNDVVDNNKLNPEDEFEIIKSNDVKNIEME